jgi:hypothetical protein
MSREIDIPGGKAVLRERLSVRQSRLVERAKAAAIAVAQRLPEDLLQQAQEDAGVSRELLGVEIIKRGFNVTQEDLDVVWGLQDATILAYLESWTLGPLPTEDTLLDTTEDVYVALAEATKDLYVRPSFEPHPDHDRPTGPSNGSSIALEGATDPEPQLTRMS